MLQRKSLLLEIQEKRAQMIHTAEEKGMVNEDTIKISQELDDLIFLYQKRLKREKEFKRELKLFISKFIIERRKRQFERTIC